ncbi:MAG TPA: hypothetical protein VE010_06655 [Thermoanaerobaculia bacterium]|nr:hypothetical protein [Thermoanaerobaculia bacterium]
MSRFLNETMSDLRGGRETWRVFVLVGGPSFFVAVAATLLQMQ